MSWQKPVSKKCPKCGGYMVEKGNKIACADETCGYIEAKTEKRKISDIKLCEKYCIF